MKMMEYLKVHRHSLIILTITIVVSVFIAVLGAKMIPLNNPEQPVYDTIYVERTVTDSLLKDISGQVHEINSKIPVKRTQVRQKVQKCDTIKVDATIHLDKDPKE